MKFTSLPLNYLGISNQALKRVIEGNYWKNRSELSQPSEINYAVWWVKTNKTLETKNSLWCVATWDKWILIYFFFYLFFFSDTFSKFEILFSFLCRYFSIIFCTFHVAQIFLDSYQLFLNLTKVWFYNLHVLLRLSESRIDFVLPCASFQ